MVNNILEKFILSQFPISGFANIEKMIVLPSEQEKKGLVDKFSSDLKTYCYTDKITEQIHPVICCVCDSIAKSPNWYEMVPIDCFAKLCGHSNLQKSRVCSLYPDQLLMCYTVRDCRLQDFILSPKAVIDEKDDSIMVCKECKSTLQHNLDTSKTRKRNKPPKEAIANGFLIGEAPEELISLNDIELSLVSRVRIYAQTWTFFAGCHQQIKGWHTFFKNRNTSNVAQLQNLQLSGMKGSIMVVLCGPFTSDQKALTHKKVQVDPKKVIKAFQWLKKHNFHYKDDVIPTENDIPVPIIVEDNL